MDSSLSWLLSVVFGGAMFFAILRLFSIASLLKEIRDELRDQKLERPR